MCLYSFFYARHRFYHRVAIWQLGQISHAKHKILRKMMIIPVLKAFLNTVFLLNHRTRHFEVSIWFRQYLCKLYQLFVPFCVCWGMNRLRGVLDSFFFSGLGSRRPFLSVANKSVLFSSHYKFPHMYQSSYRPINLDSWVNGCPIFNHRLLWSIWRHF